MRPVASIVALLIVGGCIRPTVFEEADVEPFVVEVAAGEGFRAGAAGVREYLLVADRPFRFTSTLAERVPFAVLLPPDWEPAKWCEAASVTVGMLAPGIDTLLERSFGPGTYRFIAEIPVRGTVFQFQESERTAGNVLTFTPTENLPELQGLPSEVRRADLSVPWSDSSWFASSLVHQKEHDVAGASLIVGSLRYEVTQFLPRFFAQVRFEAGSLSGKPCGIDERRVPGPWPPQGPPLMGKVAFEVFLGSATKALVTAQVGGEFTQGLSATFHATVASGLWNSSKSSAERAKTVS